MVPVPPTPDHPRAAEDARDEIAWALRLLRHRGQLPGTSGVSATSSCGSGDIGWDGDLGGKADVELVLRDARTSPSALAQDHPPRGRVANLRPDEPDAGNPHVRICGSPGVATPRGHPAPTGAPKPPPRSGHPVFLSVPVSRSRAWQAIQLQGGLWKCRGLWTADCPHCARTSLARENRRCRILETRGRNPAGESPVRPKRSRQVGSESCVDRGDPGCEA